MNRPRMRARSLRFAALAAVTLASTVGAACADSDSPGLEPVDDGGRPDAPRPDASSDGAVDADADARAPGAVDACSAAGWCATDVDRRLSFDDLWPLEHSAVAVASRAGRSAVLLYEDSSWKVIHEVPFLLASVWASA
ncbi:MAG: hypothetical protein K0S65_3960, partial [Labilithrix sp.]|nr:hypothetical protein [Labilithrix sp.]